ncbi:MAG: hypothetical protein JST30_15745 [Armatimonadetes bacterium]|nr:hypothetical protein [Armatimonadota bacterium]
MTSYRNRSNRRVSWALLALTVSLAQGQGLDTGRLHPCGESKARALAGLFNGGQNIAAADLDTDLKYEKLDIELLPNQTRIQGTVTFTFEAKVDALTTARLYLDTNGTAMGASAVGGAATGFSQSADVLTLTLDRAYAAGELFQVTVTYGGTPRNTGYGSFLWEHHGSGLNYNWAISSLSEPFFARTWWPCKDVLGDKADTADVWITVPNDLTAVSNGTLQGVDSLSGNRLRYRWSESYPIITYLVSIAVSNYGQYSLTYDHLGRTMPMSYYLFPENNGTNSTSRQYCDLNRTQVEKLSDVFGQYPFIDEKYGMAEVMGSGAFMEHQTCSSMLGVTYESINAHELAHQWWGDMVTCGSWADIWLNEGFATYAEAIWEEQQNNGSFTAYRNEMLANYPSSVDAKVLRTNLNDVNHIFSGTVYYKGAWVLHMLRGVIGYENLKATLAQYRAHKLWQSAVTEDFATEASAVWGRDLTFFFDEWIMNGGAPDYQYNWRDDTVNGQHRLRLGLWQNQSTRGYGLITMPVRFRVATTNGTVDFSLWNNDWTDVYDLALPGAVTSVTFDPETWLLINSKSKVTKAVPALPLLGDMNADGRVNLRDVPLFRSAKNGQVTDHTVLDRGDFDYNGTVDAADEAVFMPLALGNSVTGPKR